MLARLRRAWAARSGSLFQHCSGRRAVPLRGRVASPNRCAQHRPTNLDHDGIRNLLLAQERMRVAGEELKPAAKHDMLIHDGGGDLAVRLAWPQGRRIVVVVVVRIQVISNVAEAAFRPLPLHGNGRSRGRSKFPSP